MRHLHDTIFSYVNNINTVEGGTHLSGFRTALTRTVNQYGKTNKLIKDDADHVGRRHPRGPHRGGQRQGAGPAVRRPDQDQAGQR
jgi:DNA gyrase/topoisomerase IV subunit B